MDKNYKVTLAAARVNAGLTQADVANRMKVSKQTIVNWENGKIEMKPAQFTMYCMIVGAPTSVIILPKV